LALIHVKHIYILKKNSKSHTHLFQYLNFQYFASFCKLSAVRGKISCNMLPANSIIPGVYTLLFEFPSTQTVEIKTTQDLFSVISLLKSVKNKNEIIK